MWRARKRRWLTLSSGKHTPATHTLHHPWHLERTIMYACTYVCMHAYMYVRAYVRMYVYMYVCIYIMVIVMHITEPWHRKPYRQTRFQISVPIRNITEVTRVVKWKHHYCWKYASFSIWNTYMHIYIVFVIRIHRIILNIPNCMSLF